MKTLYLIGGPMGIGKTAVCQRLKKDLPNAVFLDGDWCWDADPFQVTEETKAMVLENIAFLLNRFLRCSAYENVVFCWVMHQQAILDDILSRLSLTGYEVRCVSLVSTPETLCARLHQDIRKGLRNPDVIDRSLARLPLYASLRTVKIDTTGKAVPQVADEIRRCPPMRLTTHK